MKNHYLNSSIGCVLTIIITITSCGPSEVERKQETQRLIDSAIKSNQAIMEQKALDEKIAQERKENEEKERKQRKKDEIYVSDVIQQMEIEVEVNKSKLSDTKQFQFLRTEAEKEFQIRNLLSRIKDLENRIEIGRQILRDIKSGAPYSLKTPKQEIYNEIVDSSASTY